MEQLQCAAGRQRRQGNGDYIGAARERRKEWSDAMPAMQLITSIGGDDEIRRRLSLRDQELQHGQCSLVRPMQVFDYEDRRPSASILPKQAEIRAEETVSIGRVLPGRCRLGCQGQQLGDHALQRGLAIRLPDDASNDRHEGLVRWWRFREPARGIKQGGRRPEHSLAEQTRLADAGIAGQHHRASSGPSDQPRMSILEW